MADSANLIERIPDPEAVRVRLSEVVRETELLRRMLKLAEQREKYERSPVGHPPRRTKQENNSRLVACSGRPAEKAERV